LKKKLFLIVDITISFDDASGNPAEIALSAFQSHIAATNQKVGVAE
jgi:hypothetical protein